MWLYSLATRLYYICPIIYLQSTNTKYWQGVFQEVNKPIKWCSVLTNYMIQHISWSLYSCSHCSEIPWFYVSQFHYPAHRIQNIIDRTYISRNSQTAKQYLFYCRLKVKTLKTTSFRVVTPSSGSNHPRTHRNFTLTSIADKNLIKTSI
jgi:hypothetical protein